MKNFLPKMLGMSVCVTGMMMATLSFAQSNNCQIFSATAEADGLDNAERLATDALFNLLARNGKQVTMTSTVHEPQCLFTEVGNNVQCVAEATICP
jgi:hypothetical protein